MTCGEYLCLYMGLAQKKGCPSHFGLFDGDDYVFTDSNWMVVNFAKLFWRYGFDIYRLNKLTEDMLGNFARIYRIQAEGKAFRKVTTMLHAMDSRFLDMTRVSTSSWLKTLGFHERMIQEFVMAVTKCNYGQTPDIQGFVGAIAVAAADSNLWSVNGGNKRVPEELLKASRAAWLRRLVTEVALKENGLFTITSVDAETPIKRLFVEGSEPYLLNTEDINPRSQDYDIVIIATPLTEDKSIIKFVNFTEELQFPGRYERIVCTMVQGELRPESLKMMRDEQLDEILVTNPRLIFNSFGKQYPVDADCAKSYPDVWKIFSPRPISEDQMRVFFEESNSTNVIDWLAYPHYDSNQKVPDFELVPGLYHINAMEWAGSAMEMEAIGAKNVALLAYKYWMQDDNAGSRVLKDEL
ncbi:Prenylcysteine oxidase-like [Halocaridina rubra]|uniref:Prenylcysteine oxidase-like n=1 Tax=Halocaridina rubra TaxID=373956 RepID=A0AAN8ZYY0_HALRR